jgi:O-antigen/teichoic acid export membrane protein
VRKTAAISLLDQFVSAAALFLFASLISKSLGVVEFGKFSVFLAWVSLLSALLQPALIDSSTVMDARRESNHHDWGQVALKAGGVGLFTSGSLALIGILVGDYSTFNMWTMLVVSELSVSLLGLYRRMGYSTGPIWVGLLISTSSLILTALILPKYLHAGSSVFDAIYCRMLINTVTVLPFAWWYSAKTPPISKRQLFLRVSQLFKFSKTYIGGSAIFWGTNSLQIILIGHALAMSEAAGYRAAQLLVIPIVQLQAAIYQIAMPRTVKRAQMVAFSLQQEVLSLFLIFVLPALFYAVVLAFNSKWLLVEIFGHDYSGFYLVLTIMGVNAIFEAAKQVGVITIYALNQQTLFMRYRIWALLLFAIGIAPALWWGNLLAFVLVGSIINLILLCFLAFHISFLKKSRYQA